MSGIGDGHSLASISRFALNCSLLYITSSILILVPVG